MTQATKFESAFQKILDVEGREYTNIKDDDGGPTKFGITMSTLSDFRHKLCMPDDVKNLTEDEARDVYRVLFWDRLQLDRAPSQMLAYVLFNQAVNFGAVKVAKKVQTILRDLGAHVVIDGVFGPMSVNALISADPKKFLAEFMKKTYVSYAKSVVADPDDLKFLVGWMNRANSLLDLILEIK